MVIEKIEKEIPFTKDGVNFIRKPNLEDVVRKVDEIVEHVNKPSVLTEGAFSDGREEVTPAPHLLSDIKTLIKEVGVDVYSGNCFHDELDFRLFIKSLDALRLKSLYLYMANGKGE